MSEARLMGCRPDYTVCIIRNGRLTKMQKKLDAKVVTIRDKKTRQLLIWSERFCVCRFIQAV